MLKDHGLINLYHKTHATDFPIRRTLNDILAHVAKQGSPINDCLPRLDANEECELIHIEFFGKPCNAQKSGAYGEFGFLRLGISKRAHSSLYI